MSNWKTVRLGDIATFAYGTMPKKKLLGTGVFPTFSGYKYQYVYPISNCKAGDLIVVARGVGGTGDVKKESYLTNLSILINLDNSIVLNRYFYYKYSINSLRYLDSGSAQSQITINDLRKIDLSIPSLAEQERIAGILGSLDDKIECNNRINRNLEEQAAVLFRRWFVDFEFPDANGNPYKSSGSTFIDSPLGEIPTNWKVGRLSDCTAYISRGVTPKYVEIGKEIILNQKCIRNHDVSFNESRFHTPKVINDKWLKFGDILINSTGQGTLGRVAQFFYNNNNVTVDSHVSIVRPIADNYIHFIGQALIGRETEIESMAAGSTGQTELPRERLNNMEIIIPGNADLIRFHTAISPFMKMKIKNRRENQALKGLRDTLLPKLMNNEI